MSGSGPKIACMTITTVRRPTVRRGSTAATVPTAWSGAVPGFWRQMTFDPRTASGPPQSTGAATWVFGWRGLIAPAFGDGGYATHVGRRYTPATHAPNLSAAQSAM